MNQILCCHNLNRSFPTLRARRLLHVATLALLMAGLAACGRPQGNASAGPPASSASANVSDIDVTEHVKTLLSRSESLKAFDIAVVTLKGDVRLTGVVDNQAQIDEAIRIARAAEGAHSIHDELTTRK